MVGMSASHHGGYVSPAPMVGMSALLPWLVERYLGIMEGREVPGHHGGGVPGYTTGCT